MVSREDTKGASRVVEQEQVLVDKEEEASLYNKVENCPWEDTWPCYSHPRAA